MGPDQSHARPVAGNPFKRGDGSESREIRDANGGLRITHGRVKMAD